MLKIEEIVKYDKKIKNNLNEELLSLITFTSFIGEDKIVEKSYTKIPKDITDMKKLEPYINQGELAMLQEHKNQDIIIQNIDFPEQMSSKGI